MQGMYGHPVVISVLLVLLYGASPNGKDVLAGLLDN
jgi:hypothetical protein